MSSLARRSLRATAAVAGIAAAGVGIAAPALAAPAQPALPQTDGVAAPDAVPAPDAVAAPDLLGQLRAEPTTDLADPPQLFTIGSTKVYTAGEDVPELPEAGRVAPELPAPGDVVDVTQAQPDLQYRNAAPADQGSALQQLDTASMFGDVAGRALGATQGNDIG